MKIFSYLLILILLSCPAYSLHTDDLKSEIESASVEVNSFFADVSRTDFLVVSGSHVSMEDKMLFNLIRTSVDYLQSIKVESDVDAIKEYSGKTIILLGSERTNVLSKKLTEDGLLIDAKESRYDPLILKFAKTTDGKKVMMAYSLKEINNNENHAITKSPLAKIMDKKYVPAAATFLSILLLYLWSILGKTAMALANEFISSKILGRASKDKKVNDKIDCNVKLHKFFTPPEIISFFITVLVFTITMSWSWSSDFSEFKAIFFINLIIIILISGLREFLRQLFCYRHKVKTEFTSWPAGAFLTLITTYFGVTFSLASYTLTEDNINEEKRLGKQAFLISLMTYSIALIAYILNILFPSLTLQMIFVFCIMTVFIEFFPFSPFAGNDIKDWNLKTWIIAYAVTIATYISMNFTLYL
ncbi:MAG: hypothetical protein NDI94_02790 [Candidatus Woesearchaeota archaeon]|nr:hypothetical protein [Candidatus Woesearchaeota archaeon]